MQKTTLSEFGTKLFLRALIAAALCMVVYLSFGFIFTAIGTKQEGYTVYHQEEDGTLTNMGDYYFNEISALEEEASAADGTGTTAAESVYYRQAIRTEMSPFLKVISFILSEICMLGMYISMLYVSAWEQGRKNAQNDEGDGFDKWFGLRAGAFATLPLCIAWVVLLMSKLGWFNPEFAGTFKLLMAPWFPIVTAMMPAAATASMAWWVPFAMLPLMALKPATTHVAYVLGANDIVLRDKILYKGKKKKKKKSRRA